MDAHKRHFYQPDDPNSNKDSRKKCFIGIRLEQDLVESLEEEAERRGNYNCKKEPDKSKTIRELCRDVLKVNPI